MTNKLSAFIILTASILTSAIMIPADPAKIFDLTAQTTELVGAPTTSGGPDFEIEPFFEFEVGRHHRCYWSGTAPLCIGYCGNGYIEKRRNKCGNGFCCWAGSKALCCRRTRRGPFIIPPIPHHRHKSNPPPPQHLHAMHQLPKNKHDSSHYPEEDVQNDSAAVSSSERLPAFDYLVGGFGGLEEDTMLERFQGEKGSEFLTANDVEIFKKDSVLKSIKPELLVED